MRISKLNSERGMAALVALLLVGMLTIIGIAALSTSNDEVQVTGNQLQETQSFYAAESGLNKAQATLAAHYDTANSAPAVMPSGTQDLNNSSVTYNTVDNGAPTFKVLSYGSVSGLQALVHSFSIASTGSGDSHDASVTLRETFQVSMVPLFEYAIFYNKDLELSPGFDLNLLGRVHSNGDIYIQATDTLAMASFLTAAGSIIHGHKGPGPGIAGTGDVQVKNGIGSLKSMKNADATWLDCNYPTWYDTALARWNGRVGDKSMAVLPMNVPLANVGQPHKMIEPAAGLNTDSYENQATLKIIDNVAYRLIAGVWTNVTAAMTAAGIITYTTDKFTDARELKAVDVTDLDLTKLQTLGFWPANGIFYFSQKVTALADFPALRLTNGATLAAPLTIASANPVYTLGDYNKNTKKPAAILADALTMLSNKWSTGGYDAIGGAVKTSRPAQNTTVNVAYCTGNVNTTAAVYSGGFENLVRFLEDWSGKTLTWTGSGVCLWNSTQAMGLWNGTYYTAPTRSWQFDASFNWPDSLPIATPDARVFQRVGWSQDNVGYAGN